MKRALAAAPAAVWLAAMTGPAAPAAAQQVLPTVYEEHRFFVTPVTEEGEELELFTDTGGGLFLFDDVAERLGLPTLEAGELEERLGIELPEEIAHSDARFAELPPFRADAGIPPALTPWGESRLIPLMPRPEGPEAEFAAALRDGMLGQAWFAGRTWTFDYPDERLLLHDSDEELPAEGERMELGFQTDAEGNRATNYPRMQIVVAGDTLDMLFDTGATTLLTDAALDELDDGGAAVRATSFIVASLFDRWRERNPEWRVIEGAERGSGMDMIEARDVEIAGHTVEAVWFTRRLDANFHDFMSQWMDRRIDGAVGGNALLDFRVTVDYPRAVAVFEVPELSERPCSPVSGLQKRNRGAPPTVQVGERPGLWPPSSQPSTTSRIMRCG